MAIVTPANDAFEQILSQTTNLLDRKEPITRAITIGANLGKGKRHIRFISYDPTQHPNNRLKILRQVTVTDGNIPKGIASVVEEIYDDDFVFAHEQEEDDTCRWTLWNHVSRQPELIDDKKVTVSYRNI